MNNDHETVLAALLAYLQAKIALSITADALAGSPTLNNVSSTANLYIGLPVFGVGIPASAFVAAFDPIAQTITLSQPVTVDGLGGSFAIGFLTTGRRLKSWTDVKAQPAMFLRLIATTDQYTGGASMTTSSIAFGKTELDVELWIYSTAAADPNAVPGTALNYLVRAVREAFAFDSPAGLFTIGGVCHWCRIQGKATYDSGDIDGQSKALLPVRIMIP